MFRVVNLSVCFFIRKVNYTDCPFCGHDLITRSKELYVRFSFTVYIIAMQRFMLSCLRSPVHVFYKQVHERLI